MGTRTARPRLLVRVSRAEPVLLPGTVSPQRDLVRDPLVQREALLRVRDKHVHQTAMWTLHSGMKIIFRTLMENR